MLLLHGKGNIPVVGYFLNIFFWATSISSWSPRGLKCAKASKGHLHSCDVESGTESLDVEQWSSWMVWMCGVKLIKVVEPDLQFTWWHFIASVVVSYLNHPSPRSLPFFSGDPWAAMTTSVKSRPRFANASLPKSRQTEPNKVEWASFQIMKLLWNTNRHIIVHGFYISEFRHPQCVQRGAVQKTFLLLGKLHTSEEAIWGTAVNLPRP